MRERVPCVYMLASGYNGTLYVGVTSNSPTILLPRSRPKSGSRNGRATGRRIWSSARIRPGKTWRSGSVSHRWA